MLKTEHDIEVFVARWIALLVILFPLLILIDFIQPINVSGLIIFIALFPWIIFFRKELFRILYYWYLMIRGESPGNFYHFIEGADNE